MRIASVTTANSIISQIDSLSSQQSTLQAEIASGQKVTNPEDDPTGFNSAMALENNLNQVQQYSSNSAQALVVAQASASGLQSLNAISDRAGQIAVLGTSVLGASAMQSYATETNQLIEQAVQAANTNFNGAYIYAGTADSTPPFTVTRDASGDVTGVTYAGNDSQTNIQVSGSTQVSASTDGTTNAGLATFINNLVSLRDALTSGNTTAVNATQAGLTAGSDLITSAIATNGGIQTRIQAAQTNATAETTSLQTDLSSIVNADLPSTTVKLSQTQTAYQAALQSAVSTMQLSILNYIH